MGKLRRVYECSLVNRVLYLRVFGFSFRFHLAIAMLTIDRYNVARRISMFIVAFITNKTLDPLMTRHSEDTDVST